MRDTIEPFTAWIMQCRQSKMIIEPVLKLFHASKNHNGDKKVTKNKPVDEVVSHRYISRINDFAAVVESVDTLA